MNETENTRLLRLYKLLWEQIKDDKHNQPLIKHTSKMGRKSLISAYEETALDYSITNEIGFYESRRDFVQRMITELENEIK